MDELERTVPVYTLQNYYLLGRLSIRPSFPSPNLVSAMA